MTTYDRMRAAADELKFHAETNTSGTFAMRLLKLCEELRDDANRLEACEREMRSKKARPIYGTREHWANLIRGETP